MTRPILFVSGFGRCGTTMMMTMLDRGGFPVAGPRPAYEVDQMSVASVDLDWVRAQSGRAVKWISPLEARISRNSLPVAPVVIHMDRPSREIAASQVKMLATTGLCKNDRRTRRAFTQSIEGSRGALVAKLNSMGTVYHTPFEWVLTHPREAAQKLAAIVKHEFGARFDIEAAAAVPIARDPRCAPDMNIELAMGLGL